MAKKAEFVFVGDADSVIKAARAASAAVANNAKASSSANDSISRSATKGATDAEHAGKKVALAHTKIGRSFSGMAKRAVGAGVAMAGAYASISGAKSAIDTTTTLAKTTLSLHKNLGLSVEQASRWAAVAKSRDIDSKALNQSFVTLSKNIGAAGVQQDKYRAKLDALGTSQKDQEKRQKIIAKGAGISVEAFKKLGISQQELGASDFDTVLKKAADGLKALPAGAERAALSAKFFGKGWQTVVPILRGGSKAMEEQLALADKYGVTLKGKTVKSVEDLIAAQRENKFATMGLQVAVGQELIPAVTKGARAFNKFVLEMREGKGAGGEFAKILKRIYEGAKPVVEWLGRAAKNVSEFTEKHPDVAKLAGAVIAVGVALKTLKFASAATGFTGLLKAGRTAMTKLVGIFAAGGATAGAAAGAGAADGMASKSILAKMKGKGRLLGGAFGVALGAAALVAIAKTDFGKSVGDLGRKITNLLPGKDQSKAQSDYLQRASDSGNMKKYIQTHPYPKGDGTGVNVHDKAGDGPGVNLMGSSSNLAPFATLAGKFGLGVSSGRRPGAITSSGNVSLHASGNAIDVAGSASGMLAFFKFMKANYGPKLAELIYSPGGAGIKNGASHTFTGKVAADHHDHVHVGYTGGPVGMKGTAGVAVASALMASSARSSGPSLSERQERAGSRLVNKLARPFMRNQSGFAGINRMGARSLGAMASGLGTAIDDASTRYGLTERAFGQSEEDLGTAAGRDRRLSELKVLKALKREQLARQQKRAAALKARASKLSGLIKAINKALTGKNRARGAKAAKIRERRKAYEDDLLEVRAEAKSLGFEIAGTELDIGDLEVEAAGVSATPDTAADAGAEPEAGPSPTDRIGADINSINLQERAGQISAAEAKSRREAVYAKALKAGYGNLTVDETYQIMGDLKESTESNTEAVSNLEATMKELKASIDAQLAFADRVSVVTSMQAVRAMADVMSGQLGYRVGARATMAGSGQVSRL